LTIAITAVVVIFLDLFVSRKSILAAVSITCLIIAGIFSFTLWNTPSTGSTLGGNFMVDGWGRGFCSELVFDENGTAVDEIAELDSVLGAFMNLDTVYTFPRFFGIDHIDMSMKLLNDLTCILNLYPAGNVPIR
jgi:hypothetical protein